MNKERIILGRDGEEAAVRLLKENGYKILNRNYRSKSGEIDIVARDKDTIVFIEVKTRTSDKFGTPVEAVLKSKQLKISKAALFFLKEKNLLDNRARFDVVSVIYADNIPRVSLIKNAFELDDRFTY